MSAGYKPTEQQQAILDWIDAQRAVRFTAPKHAIVEARAGTGKTTTLVLAIPQMWGDVMATAYNRDIAKELAGKVASVAAMCVNVAFTAVKTSHAFGYEALRTLYPRVTLDMGGRDWFNAVSAALAEAGHPINPALRGFVRKAVNAARQRAVGILCPLNDAQAWMKIAQDHDLEDVLIGDDPKVPMTPEMRQRLLRDALNLSRRFLAASIKLGGKIVDGDGMIYVPVYFATHGDPVTGARLQYKKYDWCLMDEAQDVNPLRRVQFKLQMKRGARALFVGDSFQAINAWAGADSDSMDIIRREFSPNVFPLNVTWRCPQAVVRSVQHIVPDYRAAPEAPEGSVESVAEQAFLKPDHLKSLVPGRDVVLCRNTRPLVELAFAMVRSDVACYLKGRDLAVPLLALAKRWSKGPKAVKTVKGLRGRLAEHVEKETARLMALDQEDAVDRLNDEVETLHVFMAAAGDSASIDTLCERIKALFAKLNDDGKENGVALSTGHRSKGMEWDHVHILGENAYQPSKYARTKDAIAQENHLIYVMRTRAKKKLVHIVVPTEAAH